MGRRLVFKFNIDWSTKVKICVNITDIQQQAWTSLGMKKTFYLYWEWMGLHCYNCYLLNRLMFSFNLWKRHKNRGISQGKKEITTTVTRATTPAIIQNENVPSHSRIDQTLLLVYFSYVFTASGSPSTYSSTVSSGSSLTKSRSLSKI